MTGVGCDRCGGEVDPNVNFRVTFAATDLSNKPVKTHAAAFDLCPSCNTDLIEEVLEASADNQDLRQQSEKTEVNLRE